ncbi:RING [Pristimantis euphronides]
MAAAPPAPDSAAPTWESAELYSPQIPEFTANSGIQFDTTELTALDFFQIFVSDDLIAHMVAQTNLYAEKFIRDNPTASYANQWTPVDAVELRKFWGLTLYMGLVKKPTIRAYWSTDLLYHTSLFRVVMPRTRYEAIQKFIHYNDNSQCPSRDDPQYDRLYKIRPVLEHFNAKFAQAYTPEKNISIDESLVHFRGRLKFRQYLPSKRARYGIKVYKLCESTSGYTFKFRIYEGKDRKIYWQKFSTNIKYNMSRNNNLGIGSLTKSVEKLLTFKEREVKFAKKALVIYVQTGLTHPLVSLPVSAMSSVDLRNELLCSICLSTYTDPVLLRCGHNYCQLCIGRVLDTQAGSRVYSCPECREKFQKRPELMRNLALRNIMENLLSTQPTQETGIFCTYCVDSPVPAVKSCLHCEASLCDKHLRSHSKSSEHVLSAPSTSLENRKCSIHKKILEYYCTEDAACICVYCVAGGHRGHQVERLDEAFMQKKKKLRNVLQTLKQKKMNTEERVQGLEKRRRKAQGKAEGEAERVTALCTDIRRRVDDLEKKVLREISRQEQEKSLSLSALIQKLEIKKDELSRKIRHIEEQCNRTDPLTVLQEPDTGDLCDPEEEGGDEETRGHGGGDEETGGHGGGDEDTGGHGGGDEDTGGHGGGDEEMVGHDVDDRDLAVISDVLHTLCDIITGIRRGILCGGSCRHITGCKHSC